eukprot:scaffold166195_cov15-Tisochrysis_lutea.AAC.1
MEKGATSSQLLFFLAPITYCIMLLKQYAQEGDEISRDWTTLFDNNLFKFDTSLIPEALALYEKLHVKKAPLTLIPPQLEGTDGVKQANKCKLCKHVLHVMPPTPPASWLKAPVSGMVKCAVAEFREKRRPDLGQGGLTQKPWQGKGGRAAAVAAGGSGGKRNTHCRSRGPQTHWTGPRPARQCSPTK